MRIAPRSTVGVGYSTAQQLKQPRLQTGFASKRFQGLNEAQKSFLYDVLRVGILSEPSSRELQQPSMELRNKFFPGSTVAGPNAVQKLIVKLVQ